MPGPHAPGEADHGTAVQAVALAHGAAPHGRMKALRIDRVGRDMHPVRGSPVCNDVVCQRLGHHDHVVGRAELGGFDLRGQRVVEQAAVAGRLRTQRRVDFQHQGQAGGGAQPCARVAPQRVALIDRIARVFGQPGQRGAGQPVGESLGPIRRNSFSRCDRMRAIDDLSQRRGAIGRPRSRGEDGYSVAGLHQGVGQGAHVNRGALMAAHRDAAVGAQVEDAHQASTSSSRGTTGMAGSSSSSGMA